MGYRVTTKRLNCSGQSAVPDTHGKRCFLGISVGSQFISGKHVQRVLQWIDSRYEECVILVGDDVQIYNEIMAGYTYLEAQRKCASSGERAVKTLGEFLQGLNTCKFSLKRWGEFSSKGRFLDYKNMLSMKFRHCKEFKESIIGCAEDFLKRKNAAAATAGKSKQFTLLLSIGYILEEMAVFCQLIEIGYSTILYPGTFLKIFGDEASRQVPYDNIPLKNGTYISLSIKKT